VRYRILYWKCKKRLKKQMEAVSRLTKERRENRSEIKRLRRMVASLEDGYVVEWCHYCENQIVMLWNLEKDGLSAFCPVCGHRMMLCDSCKGECDYNYGSDVCKEM